ncbi:MAG TPA: hypothetical protein VK808_06305, partial [Bacteroidia bacterium]|nr:hypothetical protein [Bacteroidia bacterium]
MGSKLVRKLLYLFIGASLLINCKVSLAQDSAASARDSKDALFAKYLSDTLNAPTKIRELLSLLQNKNNVKDKTLALEEYEVAFSLAPYVRDSFSVLTPLYAQFSGMLDNAGAREMAIEYAKKALEYRHIDLNKPGFEYNLIGRIAGFYVRSRDYD